MSNDVSNISIQTSNQQSPELNKLSVRCALAKKEWDELIRTGRKSTTTRRELSHKWNVEYSVLCRKLRVDDHRRDRRDRRVKLRPADQGSGNSIQSVAAPPMPLSSPGPEVLSYYLSATSEVINPPPPRTKPPPAITPMSRLCEMINVHMANPIPPNSAMRRVDFQDLESEKRGWTAFSGDKGSLLNYKGSLLSSSEEEAIRRWFRFRLDVADLVTVYELVDAANSVILISTKGVPLDEGDGKPHVPVCTLRYATTRWAREFMVLRPDLFWSSVKPQVYNIKERPVPDTHCFIEWFFGAYGSVEQPLEPRELPPVPVDLQVAD